MADENDKNYDGLKGFERLVMYRLDELKEDVGLLAEKVERRNVEIFGRLNVLEQFVAAAKVWVKTHGTIWGALGGVAAFLTAMAAWAMYFK